MKRRSSSQDLRPITNAFRAGRLVIMLLFALFMSAMILGLLAEDFRPSTAVHPHADHATRRTL